MGTAESILIVVTAKSAGTAKSADTTLETGTTTSPLQVSEWQLWLTASPVEPGQR